MYKLVILRNTVCDGRRVYVDDVVETNSRYLVNAKKARDFIEGEDDHLEADERVVDSSGEGTNGDAEKEDSENEESHNTGEPEPEPEPAGNPPSNRQSKKNKRR